MIALEGPFLYSVTVGMFAAINPCGFVMLPSFLMFFLGLEGSRPGSQRASVRRALTVSAAVSGGFITVFFAVAAITRLFTSALRDNAQYFGFAIGCAMVVLGCFMLAGWKPSFAAPQIGADTERRRTVTSMFGFGVAYAVSSIGCALPLLLAVIGQSFTAKGFLSGVVSVGLYGLGMALIVTALTVTMSFASGGLLRVLRGAMRYMDRVAAVFIMAAGFYVAWYWFSSIRGRGSDGLTTRVEGWQDGLQNTLFELGGWKLLAIFAVPVLLGLGYVWLGRRRRGFAPESVSPASAEPTEATEVTRAASVQH